MTTMPPEIAYGQVTGRFIAAWADGPDTNRTPDPRPLTGLTVKITPKVQTRRLAGPSPVLIATMPVTCSVNDDGMLIDAEGAPGVWLVTGAYTVSYSHPAVSIPTHDIEVTDAHEVTPLDLVTANPPGGPVLTASEYAELRALIDGLVFEAAGVSSVNGQTGAVTLDAAAVGALPSSYTPPAQSWNQITGKPTTFAPTAHATSHATGGTDPITPASIGAAPTVHGHDAAAITDLTETVQDIVGALIKAGSGTTVSYDDAAGTFTITSTAITGDTDPEIVRDVIGSAMVAGSGIQITVNDAGDTITVASTAVLPTRKIQAGTGLSGGGDLSADRTLSVSYGTTEGTAAQGNDVRLSDARTPTAHNHAAEDINSGTFAPARLGTGTPSASTVLYGDGAWKDAPSGGGGSLPAPGAITPPVGGWLGPYAALNNESAVVAAFSTVASPTLIYVPQTITVDQICINVDTASAGITAKVIVYGPDGNQLPGAAVLISLAIDCGTTGLKVVTIPAVTLAAGTYYARGIVSADNTTVRLRCTDQRTYTNHTVTNEPNNLTAPPTGFAIKPTGTYASPGSAPVMESYYSQNVTDRVIVGLRRSA